MRLRLTAFLVILALSTFFYIQAQTVPNAAAPTAATAATVTPPQPPAPAPAANTAAAGTSTLSEAGRWHFGSDPTVWIMIFIFNLALFVVVERIYVIRKVRGDSAALVQFMTEALHRGDSAGSIADKAAEPQYGLAGRIAAASLKGWAKGEGAMQEYADAALIAERRALEKRLVILSTLGNNTPFIGLLGTVLGIMKAFRDLAEMGDSGPSVVMRGISEALIATAMGLAVAIPVVIAYNALSRTVQDKLSEAEEVATLLRAMRLNQ